MANVEKKLDAKVETTAEELTKAIQNGEVDYDSEEEAGFAASWNGICQKTGN